MNLPHDRDSKNPLAKPLVDALRQIVALRRELDEMTRDRDSYRLVASQAVHALHDLTERHQRQTARYRELLERRRSGPASTRVRNDGIRSKDVAA